MPAVLNIPADDALGVAVVSAIRKRDVDGLQRLLRRTKKNGQKKNGQALQPQSRTGRHCSRIPVLGRGAVRAGIIRLAVAGNCRAHV
jgi:hypothetical protein